MSEELVHFYWQYAHHNLNGLTTQSGQIVKVIHPGEHNVNSGPDFFNAKVDIGGTLWAGNVEIHVKGSDWYRHSHHLDSAYDSVILHLVVEDDEMARNTHGHAVETLVIPFPERMQGIYDSLIQSTQWIPCGEQLKLADEFFTQFWLSNLVTERLSVKSEGVLTLVKQENGSWEEAFYQSVCRSIGLKINALPFELLAKATPLKYLAKHKSSLFQLESMLFGQSGLLAKCEADPYVDAMRKEYTHLAQKFGLKPIDVNLWKFLRLRPSSFPTVRIAQLARLVHGSSGLFSKAMELTPSSKFSALFSVSGSEYWKTHYVLGKETAESEKRLGKAAVNNILINAVIPFMFAYGQHKGQQQLKDNAVGLLEHLPSEENSVTKGFEQLNVKSENAFFSQALIHLKASYCDQKKCLYCRFGARILLKG